MDFTMCLALTNGTVVKKKCACMTKLALWKILMATMKQTNKHKIPPHKNKNFLQKAPTHFYGAESA
jgi:hypothetical protein